MSEKMVAYFEVFKADERFIVFALGSLVLALALIPLMRREDFATSVLLASAAVLLVFAFVVLAPLSYLSLVEHSRELSPVTLNFNFGFLALGGGLAFKFLKKSSRSSL